MKQTGTFTTAAKHDPKTADVTIPLPGARQPPAIANAAILIDQSKGARCEGQATASAMAIQS
jgi:hypothetical protein